MISKQNIEKYKDFAFEFFMQQLPNGEHAFSISQIAKKLDKEYPLGDGKKHSTSTIHRWSNVTNDDGSCWKVLYTRAVSKVVPLRVVKKKETKVADIKSVQGNTQQDTIARAGDMGSKFLDAAQRRVDETGDVLDFMVKLINNEIAALLREKQKAGGEMGWADVKKLFAGKGMRFVYDYWRYNTGIVGERLGIEAGVEINKLEDLADYLEQFCQ